MVGYLILVKVKILEGLELTVDSYWFKLYSSRTGVDNSFMVSHLILDEIKF